MKGLLFRFLVVAVIFLIVAQVRGADSITSGGLWGMLLGALSGGFLVGPLIGTIGYEIGYTKGQVALADSLRKCLESGNPELALKVLNRLRDEVVARLNEKD